MFLKCVALFLYTPHLLSTGVVLFLECGLSCFCGLRGLVVAIVNTCGTVSV